MLGLLFVPDLVQLSRQLRHERLEVVQELVRLMVERHLCVEVRQDLPMPVNVFLGAWWGVGVGVAMSMRERGEGVCTFSRNSNFFLAWSSLSLRT